MATIDSLQIEIKASAVEAEKAINTLCSSLQRMSNLSKQVDFSNLNKTAKELSGCFGDLSIKISNFGNKSFKTINKNLSTTNSHFGRTTLLSKKVTSGLGLFRKETDKASNSVSKFAQKVGMLYARFWLLKRAIGGLWSTIKSSMDYVEVLNYFDASFGQVADNAVGQWREAGYDSAQAYYDSFAERAGKLTTKLTGFTLSSDGVLEATKNKSLGLDPSTTMQYQAQFAQMASSMGVASENALLLSEALTKIGADLASVKNMDFEQVWGDMASGLVGMSRTLDKYGVNIRNANMQTKLAELGIDATVSSLSQADKALLRTIILLDSTKYAWGDLAETLNTPANQLRLLATNWKNLCRIIGNLFLPIVTKVLPYVNALVVALQRLFVAIGRFLGIDLSSVTQTATGGADNSGLSDILDDADSLGDSLEDDAKSAKKLKQNLMGVDELNIVSDDNDDGSGSKGLGGISDALGGAFIDALNDYLDAWNKAFDEMANKAQEIADKIEAFFKDLFEPIFEAWKVKGEALVKSIKTMLSDLWSLIKDMGKDFMEVWHQPNTEKIFENLFQILTNIVDTVDILINKFHEAWNENQLGKRILENIRDIILGISDIFEEVTAYARELAKTINFVPLLTSIESLTRAVADNSHDIFGILGDIAKRFMDFGAYLVNTFIPRGLQIVADLIKDINWKQLREDLERVGKAVEQLAEMIGNLLLKAFEKLEKVVANFINSGFFTKLADDFEQLVSSLKNAKSLGDIINAIFDFGDNRVDAIVGIFNDITRAIRDFLENMNAIDPQTGMSTFKLIGKRIGESITNVFREWDAKATGQAINEMIQGLLDLIIKALGNVNWMLVGYKIGECLRQIEWGKVLAKVVAIIVEVLAGLLKSYLGLWIGDPVSAGILTAIGSISFTVHALKIANMLAKAFTGQSIISILAGAIKKAFGSAVEEAGAGKVMADAVGKASAGTTTAGAGGGLSTTLGEVVALAGKISLVVGGVVTNILAFISSLTDGFTWVKEVFMVLGTILAGIGAYLLGAPALVVAVVAGIVLAIENIVIAVKENWGAIKEWFGGLGEWIKTNVAEPVSFFFNDTLPNALISFGETLGGWVTSVKEKFADWYNNTSDTIKNWVEENWDRFSTWSKNAIQSIKEWASNTWDNISTWATNTVNKFREWYNNATDAIKNWFGETEQKFNTWKTNVIKTVAEWLADMKTKFNDFKTNAIARIKEWAEDVQSKFENWSSNVRNTIEKWKSNVESIIENWKETVKSKIDEFKTKTESVIESWKNTVSAKFTEFKTKVSATIEEWKETAKSKFEEFKNKVQSTIDSWKSNTEQKFESWKNNVHEKFENFKTKSTEFVKKFADESADKIKTYAEETEKKIGTWKNDLLNHIETVKNDGISKVKAFVEGCKEWFSEHHWTFSGIKEGLGKAFDDALAWIKQKWSGIQDWFSNLDLGFGNNNSYYSSGGYSYGTYATGGFPEDGWFRASHGELIGSFDNGQSVVANNMQIIEGIKGGVEEAVATVLAPYLSEIADNTYKSANKSSSVVIDGREIVSAYDNRKARNGFSFT